MQHDGRRGHSNLPKILFGAAGVLMVIALVIIMTSDDKSTEQPGPKPGEPTKTDPKAGTKTGAKTGTQTGTKTGVKTGTKTGIRPVPQTPKALEAAMNKLVGPSPITTPTDDKATAIKSYVEGMRLYKNAGSFLKARTLLNKAYRAGLRGGVLSTTDLNTCRTALLDLSAKTVLHRTAAYNPEDPYIVGHRWAPGELLNSTRNPATRMVTREGIIAKCDLCTGTKIVPWYNGLASATQFRAGDYYKLLIGPFHMVVYRSQCVADIYLQDLLVKRIRVAVGKADTPTPLGEFRLPSWGDKSAKSPYTPPVTAGRGSGQIYPGEPGYPLGAKGYYVKIEGIKEKGTDIPVSRGYAIHGTSDPSSIGTPASYGCIRVGAADMEFLYYALIGYADPNDPTVNWKRFSTISIQK